MREDRGMAKIAVVLGSLLVVFILAGVIVTIQEMTPELMGQLGELRVGLITLLISSMLIGAGYFIRHTEELLDGLKNHPRLEKADKE